MNFTRKGFVRGHSVRLMTVSVRPGKPNAAASSFMSGIIREPLAGLRAPCPVPPDTPVALSSPRRTLQGILRAAEVSDAAWGSRTALNLPALTPRRGPWRPPWTGWPATRPASSSTGPTTR